MAIRTRNFVIPNANKKSDFDRELPSIKRLLKGIKAKTPIKYAYYWSVNIDRDLLKENRMKSRLKHGSFV